MKRKQYSQPASDSEMVKEPMPVTQMTTVFNPSQMALLRMCECLPVTNQKKLLWKSSRFYQSIFRQRQMQH